MLSYKLEVYTSLPPTPKGEGPVLDFEMLFKPQSSLRNREIHKAKVQTEKLKPDELQLQTLNYELRIVSLPHPIHNGHSRT
jgi:hypothetical protein